MCVNSVLDFQLAQCHWAGDKPLLLPDASYVQYHVPFTFFSGVRCFDTHPAHGGGTKGFLPIPESDQISHAEIRVHDDQRTRCCAFFPSVLDGQSL